MYTLLYTLEFHFLFLGLKFTKIVLIFILFVSALKIVSEDQSLRCGEKGQRWQFECLKFYCSKIYSYFLLFEIVELQNKFSLKQTFINEKIKQVTP